MTYRNCIVIYLKSNNEIVFHLNNQFNEEIGKVNSYGWKVIDIRFLYNTKFIKKDKYEQIKIIEDERYNYNIEKETKEFIIKRIINKIKEIKKTHYIHDLKLNRKIKKITK